MKGSSPSRLSTSVATRITGKTLRTSISWFMRLRASAAPGLALCRIMVASACCSSAVALGASPCAVAAASSGVPQLRSISSSSRRASRPALAREGAAEGERPCPLRIRGGEENAHWTALGDADQGCTLRPGGVHDRSHVVHARLQRWDAADAVGHSGSPLVEANESAERREPTVEGGHSRHLPGELNVRDEAGYVHDVEGSVACDLVGDADVAAARVTGLGVHGHILTGSLDQVER